MQVHALSEGALHERSIHLAGQEARHIVKVLRHGVGDALVFSDGRGRFVHATIERCGPQELHARIDRFEDDPREAGAPWKTLALSLLKGDHFELALEKCVELGIHRVQPLLAEHCVVRWKKEGQERKLERWRKVAEAAMKQSGRSWAPRVDAPCDLATALADPELGTRRIWGDELLGESYPPRISVGAEESVVLFVGPEGSFSERERELLRDGGAEPVSLGPFILRAETAAIALCAAVWR